jgi:hypothetical protein
MGISTGPLQIIPVKKVMKELDSNVECYEMFTEDDEIDTILPPNPTIYSSLATSSSFVGIYQHGCADRGAEAEF